jgi:hypothetical protein
MKRQLVLSCAAGVIGLGLAGWSSSPGSMGSFLSMPSASLFKKLGGMQTISSLASRFVRSSMKDPSLAGLTAGKSVDGKSVDPAATTGHVATQLCAMLGGGCTPPLNNAQVASASSKLSPQQATAISAHFRSSLRRLVSNPLVRAAVLRVLGPKIPGVLSGFL